MPPKSIFDHRLTLVFPPGFDKLRSSSSSHSSHYSYTPEQFSHLLIDSYNPIARPESIVVKSTWYGKQENSAEHEFIMIKVQDISIDGLINYMVLDRNVKLAETPVKAFAQSQVSVKGGKAIDTFRVSYDGDMKKLLDECSLSSARFLEQIDFDSGDPLFLYQLVTLAQRISARHPDYTAVDSNCYLYAGLTWGCLLRLRPDAIRNKSPGLEGEKGRFGRVRYTPKKSKVIEICNTVSAELEQVQSKISNQNELVDRIIQAKLAQMGITLAAAGLPSSGSS